MNYLIYGQENYLVKNKYLELIKDYNNLSVYQNDYTDKLFSIENLLNEINSIDLFSDKKIYIVNNCNFLKAKDKFSDEDYKLLDKYLDNSNIDNDLIFILNLKDNEKIDTRKKIYKLLVKKCQVFSYDKLDDKTFKDYINKFINKYNINIDNVCKVELLNRLPIDLLNAENELKKLSLLDNISVDNIIELINPIYNDKIFSLVDHIIDKNINKGLDVYYDLMYQDNEPLAMIYQLAAQFRFIFKVKTLLNHNYNSNMIISELKQNPYYINNTINKCNKINSNRILKILNELSELDIKFKSDINLDKNIMLEMFIIKELDR